MKVNKIQQRLCGIICSQQDFWKNSNDITSPTHLNDIEGECYVLLYDLISDKDREEFEEKLKELYWFIRKFDKVMKANELSCKDLMVGDWVMVYPWDETPWMPKKITDINFHSWEGADFCDSVGVEGWDELSLDQIKPIPLTPEILEKNGFNILRDAYGMSDPFWSYSNRSVLVDVTIIRTNNVKVIDWFNVKISTRNDIKQISFCGVKYVHQLQHALRLYGITWEIIL